MTSLRGRPSLGDAPFEEAARDHNGYRSVARCSISDRNSSNPMFRLIDIASDDRILRACGITRLVRRPVQVGCAEPLRAPLLPHGQECPVRRGRRRRSGPAQRDQTPSAFSTVIRYCMPLLARRALNIPKRRFSARRAVVGYMEAVPQEKEDGDWDFTGRVGVMSRVIWHSWLEKAGPGGRVAVELVRMQRFKVSAGGGEGVSSAPVY